MVDLISIVAGVSTGLKLVDEFYKLALRRRKKSRAVADELSAEQVGNEVRLVTESGVPWKKKPSKEIKMNEWNETRYNALYRRVKINFDLYHELFVQEAGAGAQEKALIRVRMKSVEKDLCTDFRDMVSIYERTLGMNFPDHYQLYEICGVRT